MTPNETDAQVDAQNEASTATTPLEEISSNPSKDIVGGSIPSNVLDRPIESLEDDLIGTKDLQDGLIEYIKRADKPFTIALQGEWGLGKTSFLNLLKTQLCDKNNSLYYSVWIDASDFTLLQSPTSAVINMLQSMVYQIGNLNPTIMADQQGKEHIEKIVSFIKNVGKPLATKIIATGIEVATDGAISEDITKPVISGVLPNPNKQSNSKGNTLSVVKKLRDDITNLIKYIFDPDNKENYTFTESKRPLVKDQEKQGIVFFIDNLDRIDPTLAAEILEITQNIFNFEKCVFILALDYTIAIRGLQSKLGELTSDNEVIFRKYFDKFVQQSISIPSQSTAVSKLLFKLLDDVNLLKGRELNNFYQLKDTILNFAVNSLDYNPRFIKQFTNTLSLALLINEAHNKNNNEEDKNKQSPTGNIERQNTITKSLTFVILCIQISYPQIYRELSSSSFVSEIISAPRIRTSLFNNGITREEPTSVLNKWNDKLSEKFKNNRTIESQIFETIDTLRSIEEAAEDIVCADTDVATGAVGTVGEIVGLDIP